MTGFKQSNCKSSITCNGFDSLLDEPTSCGSARCDSIVKFLQRTTSGRKLVRSDGTMVNINSLRGKIVGVFFTSLTTPFHKQTMMECILDVASAYNELSKSKKGQFEIVWVAKVDNNLQFHKYLQMMPWLAIPFTDSVARNSFCNFAASKGLKENEIFLFNRKGKLFRKSAVTLFTNYGADWYPFTDARIREIALEDRENERNMDLKKLLGNARSGFVVGIDGRQVSISELENKVVGIYFCDIVTALSCCFTQMLLEVYKKLKKTGKPFEVVMISVGGWNHKKHVNGDFKKLPWLSLPGVDSNCKRLVRIFDPEYYIDNRLVIVGPRGSFVNQYGYTTIECYGIEAYPFSRSSVVEFKKKRMEASVKSLLTWKDENVVIQKGGEMVPISYLSGKTILLLLTNFCCCYTKEEDGLVLKLIEWYEEIRTKHADFEVIFVGFGFDKSSFDEYSGQMPWLAFPHDDTRLEAVFSELYINSSTLAVVGSDGQLLSMGSEFHFYAEGTKAYPFSGKELLLDVSRRTHLGGLVT